MEQHSADHFNKAEPLSDDMHHVSVVLTQRREKILEIVCLNGIDEDKIVMMNFLRVKMWSLETKRMELIWLGVPVWRKKLGKIQEEFQDVIIIKMLKHWTLTPGRRKTNANLPQRHRNQTLSTHWLKREFRQLQKMVNYILFIDTY